MAKINVPKAFDKQLLDPAFVSKADLFIDYINQQFDQLTRALDSQLTFSDNFKADIQSVGCFHNQQVIVTPKKSVVYAFPIRSSSPIKSAAIESNQSAQLVCTFKFDTAISIRTRNVAVSSGIATYDVQGNTTIVSGDIVSITGHNNSGNNGTFLVSSASTTAIVVVNPSAVNETLANYVGSSDTQKSVSLLTLF